MGDVHRRSKLKYADEPFPQSAGTSSKVINTVTATGVAGRARSSEQNDNHMRNQVNIEAGLTTWPSASEFASLKQK